MHLIIIECFVIRRLCLYQQTDTEFKTEVSHKREQLDVPNSFLYQLNEELFG